MASDPASTVRKIRRASSVPVWRTMIRCVPASRKEVSRTAMYTGSTGFSSVHSTSGTSKLNRSR